MSGINFVIVCIFSLGTMVVVVFIFSLSLSLAQVVMFFTLSVSSICFSLGLLWSLHFRLVYQKPYIVTLDKEHVSCIRSLLV